MPVEGKNPLVNHGKYESYKRTQWLKLTKNLNLTLPDPVSFYNMDDKLWMLTTQPFTSGCHTVCCLWASKEVPYLLFVFLIKYCLSKIIQIWELWNLDVFEKYLKIFFKLLYCISSCYCQVYCSCFSVVSGNIFTALDLKQDKGLIIFYFIIILLTIFVWLWSWILMPPVCFLQDTPEIWMFYYFKLLH